MHGILMSCGLQCKMQSKKPLLCSDLARTKWREVWVTSHNRNTFLQFNQSGSQSGSGSGCGVNNAGAFILSSKSGRRGIVLFAFTSWHLCFRTNGLLIYLRRIKKINQEDVCWRLDRLAIHYLLSKSHIVSLASLQSHNWLTKICFAFSPVTALFKQSTGICFKFKGIYSIVLL